MQTETFFIVSHFAYRILVSISISYIGINFDIVYWYQSQKYVPVTFGRRLYIFVDFDSSITNLTPEPTILRPFCLSHHIHTVQEHIDLPLDECLGLSALVSLSLSLSVFLSLPTWATSLVKTAVNE